jgi:hypothetical protein
MNCPIVRHSLVLASMVFLGGLASGCTTVVTPLSESDTVATDEGHGLLVGNMQLAWDASDRTAGIKQPQGMRLTIQEKVKGKRFVVANLPTDGPFLLKLPVGSYHLKDISFDGLGTWRAILPITFRVQPRVCTSLGIWELQREKKLSEWITGQVLEDLEPAQGELQQMFAKQDCSTLSAPLDSSLRSKLAFERIGPEPHYPGYID